MSGPDLRIATAGDDEFAQIIAMVEVIHKATAPLISESLNARQAHGYLMVAAAMFAGSICGSMIVLGDVRDQDKKRMTDSMARNFREGIDVGKRRTARILTETVEGRA